MTVLLFQLIAAQPLPVCYVYIVYTNSIVGLLFFFKLIKCIFTFEINE